MTRTRFLSLSDVTRYLLQHTHSSLHPIIRLSVSRFRRGFMDQSELFQTLRRVAGRATLDSMRTAFATKWIDVEYGARILVHLSAGRRVPVEEWEGGGWTVPGGGWSVQGGKCR